MELSLVVLYRQTKQNVRLVPNELMVILTSATAYEFSA